MTNFKQTLIKLHQNLNTLREREAKYGGNTPLELVNQITDHREAIALTEQALAGELTESEWREALQPLLIAIQARTGEAASGVTLGDIGGSFQDSLIAGRDVNQITVSIVNLLGQVVPDSGDEPEPFIRSLKDLVLKQVSAIDPRTAQRYPQNPMGYADPLRDALKELLEVDRGLATRLDALLTRYEQILRSRSDSSITLSGTGNIVQGKDNIAVTATEGSTAIGRVEGNVYFGPKPQNLEQALAIYRRVVGQSCAFLPMRGIDVGASDPTAAQSSLGLANVYVELDTTSQVPLTEAEKAAHRKQTERGQETRPLSALEVVVGYRRLVLLGDPGGGKSTFVNHLAHCLAVHPLDPAAGWLDHLPGWPAGEADLLPVLVILRDFAQSLPDPLPRQAEPHHLWDFVAARLADQNLTFAAEPLQERLEQGRALVLLDGLDEVPSLPLRVFVRDAVNKFMNRYPTNRYLITCRTLSYQPPASAKVPDLRLPSAVTSFELARFDEAKIDRFITAWHAELARLGTVRSEDQAGLTRQLQQVVRRPSLRGLAANPLLLTVMALVHTHKGRLPDARALLYEETVDILLWRWEQVKAGGQVQTPRLRQLLQQAERSDMDLKKVLWELAFEAHAQGSAGDEPDRLADIGELRLQKALAALKENDLNWARQVIETIKLRAGLLLERAPEVFNFPHRTFQEFLAGAWLASQGEFARQACLRAEAGALWREVILLAVGRLVYLSGDTDKPLALVGELCPNQMGQDEIAWGKVWLAGEVLLEIGLKRVQDSALGRDLLERVCERLVDLIKGGYLTPRERAEAGDVLARLGDPRPEVMTVEQMAFCYIPAGPFWLGSPDEDNMAEGDEKPTQRVDLDYDYWLARYPVTVAQFQAFVTATGYQVANENTLRDLPNHPVRFFTWCEAIAFCEWLTEKWQVEAIIPSDWAVRLPSEIEWEKAARGGLQVKLLVTTSRQGFRLPEKVSLVQNKLPQRRYPWGDEADLSRANYDATGIGDICAVGCFPRGQSLYGCDDLSGNVWEWTRSHYKGYPYDPGDGRENLKGGDNVSRVLRGGAFSFKVRVARCAARSVLLPNLTRSDLGFRVVVSPFS
ncbi:MAG: SUMF1/EgtB/PvdO family nonheme iron enzyme [Anaerolineae bacterium]|nr:SUMF1/EgtB/PvdO family nonheme iron enzyme [Anaerolineae bacterium]